MLSRRRRHGGRSRRFRALNLVRSEECLGSFAGLCDCARLSWAFVGCQSCGTGFLRMCSALDFEYGVRPITCRTESRYEDFRVRASLTVTIVHRDCGFLQKQTEGHRHCPGCAECDHHNVGSFRYRSSITPRCRRDGRRGDRQGTPHPKFKLRIAAAALRKPAGQPGFTASQLSIIET
jgi:hypothetical protein